MYDFSIKNMYTDKLDDIVNALMRIIMYIIVQ